IRVFHVTGVQTCALPLPLRALHLLQQVWKPNPKASFGATGTSVPGLQTRIHQLAQFFSWLEVRHVLLTQLYRVARFGVATDARRPVMKRKTAKAPDFNPSSLGQSLGHMLDDCFDR